MALYRINREKCSACGLCADTCPMEAISQIGEYRIDVDVCSGCGLCQEDCPSGAIDCMDEPPAG
jgi:pyruvate ferredoxin oxidoreductase delta subunit